MANEFQRFATMRELDVRLNHNQHVRVVQLLANTDVVRKPKCECKVLSIKLMCTAQGTRAFNESIFKDSNEKLSYVNYVVV